MSRVISSWFLYRLLSTAPQWQRSNFGVAMNIIVIAIDGNWRLDRIRSAVCGHGSIAARTYAISRETIFYVTLHALDHFVTNETVVCNEKHATRHVSSASRCICWFICTQMQPGSRHVYLSRAFHHAFLRFVNANEALANHQFRRLVLHTRLAPSPFFEFRS